MTKETIEFAVDLHLDFAKFAITVPFPGSKLFEDQWQKTLFRACAGNAMIQTAGDPEPELLSDLDGERVGRATMKEIIEILRDQLTARSVNWLQEPTTQRELLTARVETMIAQIAGRLRPASSNSCPAGLSRSPPAASSTSATAA